ncbi:sigma-54 interaction domain-containing protein [Sporomusa acidovorans]|uniref:Arginine utilization regulatory protein RocR n=1 Tax=Sporomusa acidovorans (strain ATCC 49682 / DSM 3132 / Mol) TaxID=1123286 RepID=A0ABZ3J526_SPOA4|nr:sigma 54-interacting transcriptional regulator [Sporomusa acidovorans]OZC15543.1 arginine utilization regulatory protein RocR [Sporomusa acidovorans DSM 3132]SDE17649.1 arginine utilization regulatory protein [Sporomusa acidovorans]
MNDFSAEKILNSLIENLEVGVHIVDVDGKTRYYNNAMGKVEGICPDAVLGKKVNEYLKNVAESESSLMKVLISGKKIVDLIQHYGSGSKKEITTINTTVPVVSENKVIAAIEISKDMTQLKGLTESIYKLQNLYKKQKKRHYTFDDIYGKSPKMKKAIEKAKKASMSNSSVLLYAETGSGKEVFAQSIHYGGMRKDRPFVPINCAAIPATLLESMLFGTEKGGFTGAENKKGLFEEANHGTILLDEVNSMEPYLQSKLLRALQEGVIRRVGSNNNIDVDVRVIATINEQPEKLMEEGRLRKDFYYRLGVLRINIPPLRERKEDIPILVDELIKNYNRTLGKSIIGIDQEMLRKFLEYQWPGNIRELKNVIEAAINMADDHSVLSQDCFDYILGNNDSDITFMDVHNIVANVAGKINLDGFMTDIEEAIIQKILRENNNNITKTSRSLNISRQDLQYKIKKYGIDIEKKS